MVKLTKIECIKKDGILITEVSGIVANPLDGKPVQKLFKAIERPIDLWFKFPDGKEDRLVIQTYLDNRTGKKIPHFILADPSKRSKNYLEQFQVCK